MFVVGQRNIPIASNSTAMEVKSDADNDHDQNGIHVKIKVNKSDIFDGRRVEELKTLIEMTINLNDKLYERAIEKRYLGRHFGRKNYQIEQRKRNVRFETSRDQRRSDGTVFMKLNAVLLREPKGKRKKKRVKRRATRVTRRATMREIADRRT